LHWGLSICCTLFHSRFLIKLVITGNETWTFISHNSAILVCLA
jgi:hypothetical protein